MVLISQLVDIVFVLQPSKGKCGILRRFENAGLPARGRDVLPTARWADA
jgi:hypothetical protein